MKRSIQASLKMMTALSFGIASILCLASRAADGQVTLQFRYGTREQPLQGRRFETMRALAHYLDERAQQVLNEASAAGARGSKQRRFLNDTSEFARRANHFHERMDNYQTSRYDVPSEVLALERRAQAVSIRIRDARVFRQTYQDWDAVLDVLNRMKQSLAGNDVQVPPAHAGFRDYDRDYAPFQGEGRPGQPPARPDEYRGQRPEPGAGPDVFQGSNPSELRRLASQLDDLASQASSMAEQGMTDPSFRGRDVAANLQRFNEDTRALRQRSDSGQIDRREIADAVNHLLADAQQINGRFGEINASGQLRNQWGQVMNVLNRMSQILQQ
jgi:hypothetical protein